MEDERGGRRWRREAWKEVVEGQKGRERERMVERNSVLNQITITMTDV
jgi:hypothetical protein